MKIVKIQKSDALYKKAFDLRYLLFFKEHNLPKEIINDGKEDKIFMLSSHKKINL
jgi:hypothetical protein